MGKRIIFFSSTGIGNAVRGVFLFSVKTVHRNPHMRLYKMGLARPYKAVKPYQL